MGIETLGGVMTPLVEANTTIPCRRSQVFSTAVDNQPEVEIHVLQGERPLAKDNKSIGLFKLDGIAPALRGVPKIEVTFEIDANGIVKVSAVDQATGKENHITIESKGNLSKEEIERIKEEAKMHEEEDKKTKEKLEKANKCESLIFTTEGSSNLLKEHMTDEDKQFFDEKLAVLKDMKESGDYTGLDAIEEEMNNRWHTISAKAYAGQGGANGFDFNSMFGGQPNGGAPQNGQDNVEVQDAK
jgi:molecular chaperone DnaK